MRITRVQASWVKFSIEENRQHVSDFGKVGSFDTGIVQIETDNGIVGIGEAKNSAGSAGVDGIGEQLMGYVQRGGFRAVKMRVGSMDGAVHVSAARVAAARAGLGPDIALMCDAHGTYTVAEAKRFCHMVRDCDLT